MEKYIWATDLAQFDVNDEALEKFEKFDTFDKAVQDAVDHFRWVGCDDVTIYVAKLSYHLDNIWKNQIVTENKNFTLSQKVLD